MAEFDDYLFYLNDNTDFVEDYVLQYLQANGYDPDLGFLISCGGDMSLSITPTSGEEDGNAPDFWPIANFIHFEGSTIVVDRDAVGNVVDTILSDM